MEPKNGFETSSSANLSHTAGEPKNNHNKVSVFRKAVKYLPVARAQDLRRLTPSYYCFRSQRSGMATVIFNDAPGSLMSKQICLSFWRSSSKNTDGREVNWLKQCAVGLKIWGREIFLPVINGTGFIEGRSRCFEKVTHCKTSNFIKIIAKEVTELKRLESFWRRH
jgi:hypothetical protein